MGLHSAEGESDWDRTLLHQEQNICFYLFFITSLGQSFPVNPFTDGFVFCFLKNSHCKHYSKYSYNSLLDMKSLSNMNVKQQGVFLETLSLM